VSALMSRQAEPSPPLEPHEHEWQRCQKWRWWWRRPSAQWCYHNYRPWRASERQTWHLTDAAPLDKLLLHYFLIWQGWMARWKDESDETIMKGSVK
jgi:hypothetical protein